MTTVTTTKRKFIFSDYMNTFIIESLLGLILLVWERGGRAKQILSSFIYIYIGDWSKQFKCPVNDPKNSQLSNWVFNSNKLACKVSSIPSYLFVLKMEKDRNVSGLLPLELPLGLRHEPFAQLTASWHPICIL